MNGDNMKLELRIVDFLARNLERSFTINEIAKALVRYYSFVNRVIGRLANEGIIKITKAGKAHLCSLDLNSEKTFALLSLAEIEKKEHLLKENKKLKLILEDFTGMLKEKNSIITIVLFGSYAKNLATEKSDMDIFLIVKKKFPIEPITKEIYAKYGVEINALVLTEKEFKAQKGKEIIREIIKDHYVLYGTEDFVKEMFK